MKEDITDLNQPESDVDPVVDSSAPIENEQAEGCEREGVDAELAALRDQLAEAKEQVLRAQAETQNVRRRAQIDVEKAHKFGVEKLVRELLPVMDGLEKAIETYDGSEAATAAMKEGIEMTLSMLMKGLEKHSVEQVDPGGEPFDPAHHEAVTMIDAPEAEPNSVINVVQKGYKLNGRLVRPAMVVVSKSSPKIDENA